MSKFDDFISILYEDCKDREGFDADDVINYLNNRTDYFTAPASTKYHGDHQGGLLEHSLAVYNHLINLCSLYYEDCPKSSIAIVALFHDLCKTNYYKQEWKSVKEDGRWVEKLMYTVEDELPLGHGEKSVILLQMMGVNLTKEEMLAIRWHMAGFDSSFRGGDPSLNAAHDQCKLLPLLQCADILASKIDNT